MIVYKLCSSDLSSENECDNISQFVICLKKKFLRNYSSKIEVFVGTGRSLQMIVLCKTAVEIDFKTVAYLFVRQNIPL